MSDFQQNTPDILSENEKYEDRNIRTEGGFLKKMEDFWFFHRGKVIVAVILMLVLALFISQIVGRRNSDVMIAYAGPAYISGATQSSVQDLLTEIVGNDLRDEAFLMGLTQYQIYSKDQIESLRAETHEDGEQVFVNSELNSQMYEDLYTYIMTGDTALLILDPWLYAELRKNERLLPMSELFETLPLGTDSYGYAIVLGETEIYQYYDVMQMLPENSVLCFLKAQVIGKTAKEKNYELMQDAFRAIVNFDAPNAEE